MATISPALTTVDGIPRITWTGVSTADTMTAWKFTSGKRTYGAYQTSGTFGGATVKPQVSVDGTTFFDMKDISGTAMTGTAAGLFDFATSANYIKPASSGGTADNVDVVIVLKG